MIKFYVLFSLLNYNIFGMLPNFYSSFMSNNLNQNVENKKNNDLVLNQNQNYQLLQSSFFSTPSYFKFFKQSTNLNQNNVHYLHNNLSNLKQWSQPKTFKNLNFKTTLPQQTKLNYKDNFDKNLPYQFQVFYTKSPQIKTKMNLSKNVVKKVYDNNQPFNKQQGIHKKIERRKIKPNFSYKIVDNNFKKFNYSKIFNSKFFNPIDQPDLVPFVPINTSLENSEEEFIFENNSISNVVSNAIQKTTKIPVKNLANNIKFIVEKKKAKNGKESFLHAITKLKSLEIIEPNYSNEQFSNTKFVEASNEVKNYTQKKKKIYISKTVMPTVWQNYTTSALLTNATKESIAAMLRCQDTETKKLLPQATTCQNIRSKKVCEFLLEPINLETGKRDVKCNLQGLEDIAESCRQTCGICCEDINYSCEDDTNGIIDCSKQLDKCHIPKWFNVLSRFCAGSCGLCARSECRDFDNTCRLNKELCLKEDTMDYMRQNCARTCGFCTVDESVDKEEDENSNFAELMTNKLKSPSKKTRLLERPPSMGGGRIAIEIEKNRFSKQPSECIDFEPSCSLNKEYCNYPIYTEYMLKFCTKTCLRCKMLNSKDQNLAIIPGSDEINSVDVIYRQFKLIPLQATILENNSNSIELKKNSNVYGLINIIDSHELNMIDKLTTQSLPSTFVQQQKNIEKTKKTQKKKKQCYDRHKKCAKWAANGFCKTENTNIEHQERLCPKSCKLCVV